MRLYWRRNLTDRSTRTRRNARSTDMDDCDDSISTMDTITMAASNKFIRSLQYASTPRPKTLSTIFDNRNAILFGDAIDGIEVNALAIE